VDFWKKNKTNMPANSLPLHWMYPKWSLAIDQQERMRVFTKTLYNLTHYVSRMRTFGAKVPE